MKLIKFLKYFLHYFFGKHRWKLGARFYYDKAGKQIDDEYVFQCCKCPKEKHIKIYQSGDTP